MTPKDILLKELETLPEPLIIQMLHYLRQLQASLSDPTTLPLIEEIYTDGACAGNPGPGGWGTVIYFADGSVHEMGGHMPRTTNNRMELQAAIAGLQLLVTSGQGMGVEVFTDSEYVKKGITEWIQGWKRRGWKNAAGRPVLNQDLWQQLDALNQAAARQTHTPVLWTYVRGHSGNRGNERCDDIARAFALNRSIDLIEHPLATDLMQQL